MKVKARDIISEMENMAPKYLKEDYDNVGLMVGTSEKEVTKVLLALDCTQETIREAKENNVDMMITHHPLMFRKASSVVNEDLQGSKIIELIKSDISLYSSHTNLDIVNDGINDQIVKVLGFEKGEVIQRCKIKGYEESGVGRLVTLDYFIRIEDLINKVKKALKIENIRVAAGKREIKKIAIINGSGQDYFKEAFIQGADCIITGDTTYHFVSDYKEMGISILDPGHFNTEWVAFLAAMKKIEDKFNTIEFIHSTLSKDPYLFY